VASFFCPVAGRCRRSNAGRQHSEAHRHPGAGVPPLLLTKSEEVIQSFRRVFLGQMNLLLYRSLFKSKRNLHPQAPRSYAHSCAHKTFFLPLHSSCTPCYPFLHCFPKARSTLLSWFVPRHRGKKTKSAASGRPCASSTVSRRACGAPEQPWASSLRRGRGM